MNNKIDSTQTIDLARNISMIQSAQASDICSAVFSIKDLLDKFVNNLDSAAFEHYGTADIDCLSIEMQYFGIIKNDAVKTASIIQAIVTELYQVELLYQVDQQDSEEHDILKRLIRKYKSTDVVETVKAYIAAGQAEIILSHDTEETTSIIQNYVYTAMHENQDLFNDEIVAIGFDHLDAVVRDIA